MNASLTTTSVATSTTVSDSANLIASGASAQRLPAIFVSHGSPMFALEPGEAGPALQRWGRQLRAQYPQLRGVVILSPHWMSRELEVMSTLQPPTWHDFGGFPSALYKLQYPAPGAPALAQQVAQLLQAAGVQPQLNSERPLDHGAWVPLMHLLPEADVPVVQLSLPVNADAAAVYALGQALRPLRDEGVLLVGSGSMTHNLRDFASAQSGVPMDYVQPFSRWIEACITSHDLKALLDWKQQAPQAHRAHPTDEHFLPLFFALGAGGPDAVAKYLSREVQYGLLSMDSLVLQDAPVSQSAAAQPLQ